MSHNSFVNDKPLLQQDRDSPTAMLQHSSSGVEQRWASRELKDTPLINGSYFSSSSERFASISGKLNSKSVIRNFLFNIKRSMMLSPMKDLIITITAGFVINMHLMIAISIAYEKLIDHILSYADSIIPLISLAALLLGTCLFSLIVLMLDLFDKGCLAWNRDSFGILFQRIIFTTCLLFSSIYFYKYIQNQELKISNDEAIISESNESILSCFIPLLICVALITFKLILFRVQNIYFYVILSLCTLAFSLLLFYEFDKQQIQISLFGLGIPFSIFLTTLSFQQMWQVLYEKDIGKKQIHGYHRKWKIILKVLNFCITICYVISLLISLYLMDQAYTNRRDEQDLFQFVLIMSMVYVISQFEGAGSAYLDIIFQQFYFDLIIDTKPQRNKYQQIYQRRMQFTFEKEREHKDDSLELQERQKIQTPKSSFGKSQLKVKVITPAQTAKKELQKPLLNSSSNESQNV